MRIKEILALLEEHCPTALAESWDNVGLLIGDGEAEVTGVELALDVTDGVIDSALSHGANLIVTHHPVIFGGLHRLESGSLPYRLAAEGLSVISMHTNLDIAQGGVNDCLAAAVGLGQLAPFRPDGLGRIGQLARPLAPAAFASQVKTALGASGVRCALGQGSVERVALCSGAMDGGMVEEAQALGADALLTGECKYHEFLEAAHRGITLVAAGHFATEQVVLPALQALLEEAGEERVFPSTQRDVEVFF
ncbi:Nif3-like dinuclear metal center hexameric protein [bacterium 210820-DFI.6.52]|nr:Nif3-like dinuclear metal center hexameric protein [bacterium 210820-DFI.6.52]